MGRYYTNAVLKRTYVTREEALECLGVGSEEFDRLCILADAHPHKPPRDLLTTKKDRIQYKVSDIHRIRESEAHQKALLKEENKRKRDTYAKTGREYRIKELKDDRTDFSKILLEKYPAFGDIYEDLGECVTCLILTERMIRYSKKLYDRLETDLLRKIRTELTMFYVYVLYSGRSCRTFLTNSGIFYSTDVDGHEVTWREAYPLGDGEDVLGINYTIIVQNAEYYAYLLEKVNFRLFKSLNSALVGYIREVREKRDRNGEVHGADAEDEADKPDGADSATEKRDKGSFGRRTVKEEFDAMGQDLKLTRKAHNGIFSKEVFYISPTCGTLTNSLMMLVLAGDGRVTEEEEACTVHLCTAAPDSVRMEKKYAHPQIVYDSCNSGAMADPGAYRPGQKVPAHKCPFKNPLEHTVLDKLNISEKRLQALEYIINQHK